MAFNKQFTIRFQKPQFRCPMKQIEKFFLGKVMGFQSSQYFDQIIFGFWEKKLSPRGVKTALGESRSRLWGFFLKKKLWFSVIFAPWAEKVRTFAKHLRQGFQNINLSVQGIIFRKTFRKLINFENFLYFEKKIFGLWAKHFKARF